MPAFFSHSLHILVVASALTALLAGCVTDYESNEGITGLHAFQATYQVDGRFASGTVHVTFDLSQAADSKREVRPTYRLHFDVFAEEWHEDPWRVDERTIDVHLDGDMRVARYDEPCWGDKPDGCNYARLQWMLRGMPPSLGFYHLQERDDDHLTTWVGGEHRQIPAPIHEEDGMIVLAYDEPFNQSYESINMYHFSHLNENTYWYEDENAIVPTIIDHRWELLDRGIGTLTDLQIGDPLPEIEAWPPVLAGDYPRGRDPNAMAGWDDILLNEVAPLDEALTYLLDRSPEAKAAWNTGCISAMGIHPRQSYSDAVIAPLSFQRTGYDFIIAQNDGTTQAWEVQARRDAMGINWTWQETNAPNDRTHCESFHDALQINVDAQTFITEAETFPLSIQPLSAAVDYIQYDAELAMPSYKPLGTESYLYEGRPEYWEEEGVQGGIPYAIAMHPSTEMWERGIMHPDDIKTLDQTN